MRSRQGLTGVAAILFLALGAGALVAQSFWRCAGPACVNVSRSSRCDPHVANYFEGPNENPCLQNQPQCRGSITNLLRYRVGWPDGLWNTRRWWSPGWRSRCVRLA